MSGLLPRSVRVVGGDRLPTARVLGGRLGAGPAAQGTRLTFPEPQGSADVNAPASDYYDTGVDLTIELWIRTTVTGRQVLVTNTATLVGDQTESMQLTLEGDRLGVSWTVTTGDDISSADTTSVSDGTWHHLAVVFGPGGVTFYKDGMARDTGSLGHEHFVKGSWYLSSFPVVSDNFVGDFYDVRVWAAARTAVEIAANRFVPPAPDAPDLSVLTSFDRTDDSAINLRSGRAALISDGQPVWGDLPVLPFVALDFTGVIGEYVALGVAGGISSDATTLECWVQIDPADSGIARTLLLGDNGSTPVPLFYYAGGDRLGLLWADTRVTSADTRVISDGRWHHLAVVIDRGTVTFVKDGLPAADSFQMASRQQSDSWFFLISNAVTGFEPFRGRMLEARIWGAARSVAQIQAMRWIPLTGDEPGLLAAVSLAGADPAQPATMTPTNLVSEESTTVAGPVTVVAVDGPVQALPNPVWTSPITGIAPSGPVVSGQGAVYAENITDGSGSTGWIRCVDLRTADVTWSYDVQTNSSLQQTVIPAAVAVADGVVYAGGQATLYTEFDTLEINALDAATGQPVSAPIVFGGSQFLTRPIVRGGGIYFGSHTGEWTSDDPSSALNWHDLTSGAFGLALLGPADSLTDPVVVGSTVFIGSVVELDEIVAAVLSTVHAVDTTTSSLAWSVPLSSDETGGAVSITAGLAYGGPTQQAVDSAPTSGDGTLVAPLSDGSLLALDARTGATLWQHALSGSPVHCTPVVLGSTVCVGDTAGLLYALDLDSGDELWRVDTGSAITTDLIYQDGVLYFANQGDGQQVPPAFVSIDTAGQGSTVLTYDVPGADTIMFAQGASNGVVYFYGQQNVYAVDMRSVVHEFSVTTTLIVEDYDIPASGTPTGSDTSYRVCLTLTDELGNPRVAQAVQVWSAQPVFLVNLPGSVGSPVAIGPDQPHWLQTDSLGTLTLAVSAFDDGTPTGVPNLACPALFAWGNFMGAGEAIVIHPDHDHLTTLATVQGSATDGIGAAPGVRYLGDATGYDGSPLIVSTYQSPQALSAIASTIRNTVGTRGGPSVAAQPGTSSAAKYLSDPASMPGVDYTPDSAAGTTRAWVPGADATFTLDLSSGQPVYQAGVFDADRPAAGLLDAAQLGSIWSDIGDFVVNVVHGAERIVKTAWQVAENAATAVLHTAESIYTLTIATLEDAVTVVTGFLKSVVADIRTAIQWLSTLLQWDNFLSNHTFIRLAIVNPGYDPTQPVTSGNAPGILDELRQWVSTEAAKPAGGQPTVFDAVASGFAGQGVAALTAAGAGLQGRSVQSTRGAQGNANSAYDYGGTSNAGQGRWLQQKVTENGNAGSATDVSVGRSVRDTAPVDTGAVTAAGQRFHAALDAALTGSFGDFPAQLHSRMLSLQDTFTDPRTLLSTGLADLLGVFETLAEDAVSLFRALIPAFLDLLDSVLAQLSSWLDEPLEIPFVSSLYQSLTGNQLSVLDLVCLLAALPATLVLDVVTGSPTPPVAGRLQAVAGVDAGDILLGLASFVIADVAALVDVISLGFSSDNPAETLSFWSRLDFACDVSAFLLGMVGSRGWSEWADHDWAFWAGTGVIQVVNFVELFAPDTPGGQPVRDAVMASSWMVMAGLYAHFFPDGYRDAPKATGLVLAGNVFAAAAGIVELLLPIASPEPFGPEILIAKGILAGTSNILGFVVDVLGIVEP